MGVVKRNLAFARAQTILFYRRTFASRNKATVAHAEGHSPVDGSRVRTPTIDQSTVDGWTFKPLIIEHQAHSDDRRSMVRHSNHSSSSSMRTLTIDSGWLGIETSNHSPSSNKRTLTIDGRWLDIQTTNHSPSSNMHTLKIDGRWLDIQTTNHSPSSNMHTLTIDGR